jgi:hypothetical protein
MKRIVFLWSLIIILALEITSLSGQSRWINIYHDEVDAPAQKVIESYDHGYLLLGWYGHSYPYFLWLLKTDINGEILWEKTFGDGLNSLVFLDLAHDNSGNIYLNGITDEYDPYGDPFIMKLNSCGEKEWCRVFYTENNLDFSNCLTITQEGDVIIILEFTNPEPWVDRICLAKLSPWGDLLWKQCYTSADTSQQNEDTYDIIVAPDQGFLITGFCYYEDPTYPNSWSLHPYYLKVDSLGIFQWETVVYKETNLHGGIASSTIVSPDEQFYYSSISHYYYDTNLASPALVKMDMDGNVISVYDVVYGYQEGKLSYAQFINDSTLAASAGWGNTDDDLWSRAVIIDTLGNLLNSTVLMEDLYTSILQVAYDGKLVYASNTYQNGQFDCYLTKLNQNLEDDTIYTRPFTYDSLCPYQIVSDTIVQDDCGLIVGIEEEPGSGEAGKPGGGEAGKRGSLEIWPNPASDEIHGRLSMDDGRLNRDLTLVIYNIFGKEVQRIIVPDAQEKFLVNVEDFPPGIYIVILKDGVDLLESRKFIIAR